MTVTTKMTLTLTIRKLERGEVGKVLKVFVWAAVSLGIAVIPALLTKNVQYVALAPVINGLLVAAKKSANQQETEALDSLPEDEQQDTSEAVIAATDEADKALSGTTNTTIPPTVA